MKYCLYTYVQYKQNLGYIILMWILLKYRDNHIVITTYITTYINMSGFDYITAKSIYQSVIVLLRNLNYLQLCIAFNIMMQQHVYVVLRHLIKTKVLNFTPLQLQLHGNGGKLHVLLNYIGTFKLT